MSTSFSVGFELEFASPKFKVISAGTFPEGYEVKYDGTVKLGYELNSPVLSSKEFIGNTPSKNIKDVFAAIKNIDSTLDSNCGMHVHVGRAGISADRMKRINALFNSNPKEMEELAGRASNSYCRLASELDTSDSHNARYHAINMVSSKPTYEFRLFASTDDVDKFFARVQLVVALVEFGVYRGNTKINFEYFGKFLTANQDRFAAVYSYYKKIANNENDAFKTLVNEELFDKFKEFVKPQGDKIYFTPSQVSYQVYSLSKQLKYVYSYFLTKNEVGMYETVKLLRK